MYHDPFPSTDGRPLLSCYAEVLMMNNADDAPYPWGTPTPKCRNLETNVIVPALPLSMFEQHSWLVSMVFVLARGR
jgi:hypothetical protein